MGIEMKMLAMVFFLGIQFCNVCTAVAADGDTEEVDVGASKTKDSCSMGRSPASSRISIVIGKFENNSNAHDSVCDGLRAQIQQCVAGTMKFNVLDREHLKEAMREQVLVGALIGEGNDAEAPEGAKFESASYIVYGTVQSCVTERSSGNVSGVGFAMSKSKIELSVKLVDARTGRIVQIKTASGHGMDKVMALNDSGCFKETGMNVAIDEVCHAVADWLRDCFACPPKVLKIYDGEITVDLNENEVEEGDVFDVVDAKDLGKDEATGAWLGFDGKTIGSVAITRTGLRTSNAIPLEGESLSLENLDSSNHTYMLRRISKDSLKKRLRRKFANEHRCD